MVHLTGTIVNSKSSPLSSYCPLKGGKTSRLFLGNIFAVLRISGEPTQSVGKKRKSGMLLLLYRISQQLIKTCIRSVPINRWDSSFRARDERRKKKKKKETCLALHGWHDWADTRHLENDTHTHTLAAI